VRTIALAPEATILVGDNGTGKSTLLESIAIAAELPTVGRFDRAADDPSLTGLVPLADRLRLDWTTRRRRGLFLRAEDFFGYVQTQRRLDREARREAARLAEENAHLPEAELARIQGPWLGPVAAHARRYDGDLDARSHGEAFLSFFRSRLTGPGLYLLDEPEAALSPVRQLALLVLLRDAAARGAQFLVATHAPILAALPGARVLELTEHGLAETDWRDLAHVDLLRSFLNEPDAYLRALETP
jgi:predicted ATPase